MYSYIKMCIHVLMFDHVRQSLFDKAVSIDSTLLADDKLSFIISNVAIEQCLVPKSAMICVHFIYVNEVLTS